jgi:hypothetical protein
MAVADGAWRLDGTSLDQAARAVERTRATDGVGDRSAEIVAFVADLADGVRAGEVEEALSLPDARRYLARLTRSGRITRVRRGLYALPESVSPQSQVSQPAEDSGQRDTGDSPMAGVCERCEYLADRLVGGRCESCAYPSDTDR